ncbi:serine hydrolase [Ornithinimicrobium cryptoxanthini]|uniref:serine hydrolase n=1 Tax=Ornithinimicrobium cryptoxanthini TaxID=2934161 RepID=UPI0021173524|nr:serine hydrolase [Ornithinimicrobium cryptoxanthini]
MSDGLRRPTGDRWGDRRWGSVTLTGLALVLVTGCSTGAPGQVTETPTADRTSETTSVTAPDGPQDDAAHSGPAQATDLGQLEGALREQSQWVLDHLAPDATGPTAEEAGQRFSAEFLAQVPADQIAPVLAQFRAGPPLTLTTVGDVEEQPDGALTTQLTLSGDEPLRLSITVDADGRIAGLFLQPGPPADLPEVGSWQELDEEFADLGGTTRVYVGEVDSGRCLPVHASEQAGEPAPSGSVFKLIVLSALVDAVTEGDLGWEDELTVTPEVKSLPSGELQDRPDGSVVTVQEAAELMISISDNTATDLLMDAVGPGWLTAALARVSDDPERLTPLLSTSQFFELGWAAPQLREQWADADPARGAELVDELSGDLSGLRANPFAVSEPVWTSGVGWFLTGEEICTAHAVLQEQADTAEGEPLRAILSANPGLFAPPEATYQAFKGGSAPGVLAFSFYVETDAELPGRVLSVQVSHDGAILPGSYTDLTQAGLGLLAAP